MASLNTGDHSRTLTTHAEGISGDHSKSDNGPATVPTGWGGAGLRLCCVQVPSRAVPKRAPGGGRGETTKRETGRPPAGRDDRMRRRELLLVLGGAIATAPGLRAQQKAKPVIGFLHSLSLSNSAPVVAAFRQGLSEAGYIEGQNASIEYRWAEGNYDLLPALAADLVDRKVDVILTGGGT